jgi:hypothetical protein
MPHPVQVWSKTGGNEGHIILEAKTVFRPCLASHWSGVSQTSQVTLPPHTLQPAQNWFKWGTNEGQFSLQAETVYRPYHAWHCRGGGGSKNTRGTPSTCATIIARLVEVSQWMTLYSSGRKNSSFLLALRCSGVTQILNVMLSPHAPQPVQVWSKSDSNKRHFSYEAETVFHPCLASHCNEMTQTQHLVL